MNTILYRLKFTLGYAKWLLLSASLSCLLACSTMPATDTGFLSNRSALTASEDGRRASYRAVLSIDPHNIVATTVQWGAPEAAGFSAVEKDQLAATLREALLGQLHALPKVSRGRAVVLRAAVTRVEAVSPALNAVATVLLIGPLDRGGAAVEVEVLDAQTGQPLASYAATHYAPLSEFAARFTRLAPAELALKKLAGEFVQLVHNPG
ncbi:MAG: hypothetical protein FD135_3147 [Comamonadaceae bacterium]|nr:MAG: hypothetical protein FD135_3147 [Comamonadaceae bacterium]